MSAHVLPLGEVQSDSSSHSGLSPSQLMRSRNAVRASKQLHGISSQYTPYGAHLTEIQRVQQFNDQQQMYAKTLIGPWDANQAGRDSKSNQGANFEGLNGVNAQMRFLKTAMNGFLDSTKHTEDQSKKGGQGQQQQTAQRKEKSAHRTTIDAKTSIDGKNILLQELIGQDAVQRTLTQSSTQERLKFFDFLNTIRPQRVPPNFKQATGTVPLRIMRPYYVRNRVNQLRLGDRRGSSNAKTGAKPANQALENTFAKEQLYEQMNAAFHCSGRRVHSIDFQEVVDTYHQKYEQQQSTAITHSQMRQTQQTAPNIENVSAVSSVAKVSNVATLQQKNFEQFNNTRQLYKKQFDSQARLLSSTQQDKLTAQQPTKVFPMQPKCFEWKRLSCPATRCEEIVGNFDLKQQKFLQASFAASTRCFIPNRALKHRMMRQAQPKNINNKTSIEKKAATIKNPCSSSSISVASRMQKNQVRYENQSQLTHSPTTHFQSQNVQSLRSSLLSQESPRPSTSLAFVVGSTQSTGTVQQSVNAISSKQQPPSLVSLKLSSERSRRRKKLSIAEVNSNDSSRGEYSSRGNSSKLYSHRQLTTLVVPKGNAVGGGVDISILHQSQLIGKEADEFSGSFQRNLEQQKACNYEPFSKRRQKNRNKRYLQNTPRSGTPEDFAGTSPLGRGIGNKAYRTAAVSMNTQNECSQTMSKWRRGRVGEVGPSLMQIQHYTALQNQIV